MRPVRVKGQNANFAKPTEWDDERDGPCGSLPVRLEKVGFYVEHNSAWKPDEEELKLLNEGGVVELCCVGIQPPVLLCVVPRELPRGE